MTAEDADTGSPLSDDAFVNGRLRILQPAAGYRAAMDAVMLGAATDLKPGGRALDVGCGAGVVSLCLLLRCPGALATGLEVDPAFVELAMRNAERNGMSDRFRAVTADLFAPGDAVAGEAPFDLVLSNPPYWEADQSVDPPDAGRRRAFLQTAGRSLGDWLTACLGFAAERGAFAFVLPAGRLGDAVQALAPLAGGFEIFPLWPGPDRPAKRLVLAGRKASAGPTRMLPGLCLHEPGRRYTEAAERVLRHGHGLALLG